MFIVEGKQLSYIKLNVSPHFDGETLATEIKPILINFTLILKFYELRFKKYANFKIM